EVLAKFSGTVGQPDDDAHPGAPVIDERHPLATWRQLLRGRHAAISWALAACGVGWGLVTFGVVLWLPVNLVQLGVDSQAARALLAQSAPLALPGVGVVQWIYHGWSTSRSVVLLIALAVVALLALAAIEVAPLRSAAATTAAT